MNNFVKFGDEIVLKSTGAGGYLTCDSYTITHKPRVGASQGDTKEDWAKAIKFIITDPTGTSTQTPPRVLTTKDKFALVTKSPCKGGEPEYFYIGFSSCGQINLEVQPSNIADAHFTFKKVKGDTSIPFIQYKDQVQIVGGYKNSVCFIPSANRSKCQKALFGGWTIGPFNVTGTPYCSDPDTFTILSRLDKQSQMTIAKCDTCASCDEKYDKSLGICPTGIVAQRITDKDGKVDCACPSISLGPATPSPVSPSVVDLITKNGYFWLYVIGITLFSLFIALIVYFV